MIWMGDYDTTETVYIPFNSFTSDDPSASVTMTNLAVGDVEVHKDGAVAQRTSTSGFTVSIDFDSVTGNHVVALDLSDNTHAGFYSAGSRYMVRIEGVTVDGATLNAWIGAFSIGCTLRPATDGRTIAVDADGYASANVIEVNGTAQTANDNGADINAILTDTGTTLQAELDAIQAAVITNAAGADIAADIIAVKAETANILTDTGTTLQGELDGIQADTEDLQTQIGTDGAGLTNLPWNSSWDTEVQSEVNDALVALHLDHLLAADYDPASKPGVATALLNELVENDTGVSRFTENALEQAPSGTGGDATEAKQDQIIAAVITNAAGTDVAADIIAVKAETANILTDTGTTIPNSIAALPTDADVNAQVDSALSDYDGPTKTELDTAFTEIKGATWAAGTDTLEHIRNKQTDIETDIATVDGIVDNILTDTGTTLDGKIDTIDGIVDNILTDTGTTLNTLILDIPTVAEFNARTLAAAAYFDPTADTVTVGTNNDKTDYTLSATGVDEVLDEPIGDGTITARQALQIVISAVAGKLSGGGTTTLTFRNDADDRSVITATVDGVDDRTAVTLNPV